MPDHSIDRLYQLAMELADGLNELGGEQSDLIRQLAEMLDDEPHCQWHRDHDKNHGLYLATRPYVTIDEAAQ